jgi:hypothetical protein
MSSEFAPVNTQPTHRRMMNLPLLGIPIPLTDRRILSDSDRARLYVQAATDAREDYQEGRAQLPDVIHPTRMWNLPLPGIPLPAGRRILSDSDRARLVVRAISDTLNDIAEGKRREKAMSDARALRAQKRKVLLTMPARSLPSRRESRGF